MSDNDATCKIDALREGLEIQGRLDRQPYCFGIDIIVDADFALISKLVRLSETTRNLLSLTFALVALCNIVVDVIDDLKP